MTARAFTLVELMVSMAVLVLLMLVLVGMTSQTSQTWRTTTAKIEQFQQARDGFEAMTRRLSQATMNPYWEVHFDVNGVPDRYVRQAELRFISGSMQSLATDTWRPTHGIFFQAPLGIVEDRIAHGLLSSLLNTWGYFLEVADDSTLRPAFLQNRIPTRMRSRLMELTQPAEKMLVYEASGPDDRTWYSKALADSNRPVRTLAENIMALVILPKLSKVEEDQRAVTKKGLLCPKYSYDSTKQYNEGAQAGDPDISPQNQLPPVVQVTMVAIDELSAQRLASAYPSAANLGLDSSLLFQDATKLVDNPATPEPDDGDLHTFEQMLVKNHLTYRIFTANVGIRGAKWSKTKAY